MSNYLYQLVAKNLNLINTVQPFVPSIFESLPETPQHSEQPPTATSFLADKFHPELSSTQPFPQPVEIPTTTVNISPTPNTQPFSSSSAYSASVGFTQKQSEAIFSPSVPQTQPVTESSGQQPVETNRFVPSPPSPKVPREQLPSHQSQPQSVAMTPVTEEVHSAVEQLISCPVEDLSLGLTPRRGDRGTRILMNDNSLDGLDITQPATESSAPQPVKIYPAVSGSRSLHVFSSEQSLAQPKPEPVTIERTSDRDGVQAKAPLQPTSHFQHNPPHPTPNIIQPINDDTGRGAVLVSASRQELQQREPFGNSVTPPTIQVSIGRMEIRNPPPPAPPRPKPRPKLPVMSLDEYLRQRRGR